MKRIASVIAACIFALTGCASAGTDKENAEISTETMVSADSLQTPIDEPENRIMANMTEIFDALNKLEYKPYTCDGLPEYRLTAADGKVYALNFSDKWVWRGKSEQAELSDELIAQLKETSFLVICDQPLEIP